MRAVSVGLLMGLALSSCVGEGGAPSTYVARDSAGVEVVESTNAVWGASSDWTVSEGPIVRIGVVEGADPYRFYRIASATRLTDGRIIVGDAGSGELRVFGPDGDHLSTIGAQGNGPGEFRSIRSLEVHGDSVVVFDDRLARVTVYRLTGELVTTWNVGMASGAIPMAMAELKFLEDGRTFGIDALTMAAGTAPALVRDTALIFELRDGTPSAEPVATLPGSWTEYMEFGGRPLFSLQPLTSQPAWDARNGLVYATPGDAFEFRIYSSGQGVERIVRRTEAAPALAEKDAQAWKDLMLERVPEAQRPMLAPMLDASTMPSLLPVYASLVVDSDGNTWLGRFTSPGVAPPQTWDVYAPDGGFLGVVRVPAGLQVFEIGTDYLLGSWEDELDVEYVQLHALRKE